MGNAILTKLIGLVEKTLKMMFLSWKHSFLPFKLGFESMMPKKQTLMAALLVGIDLKKNSLLFEIHTGKKTTLVAKNWNAVFIDTNTTWAIPCHEVVLVFGPFLCNGTSFNRIS